jgi:hypothetical protein
MKPKRPKRSPPMLLPASRIEKTKANFGLEPRSKKAYDPTRHPPALKLKTHLKAASCARNFFIAAAANGLTTPVCKASSE